MREAVTLGSYWVPGILRNSHMSLRVFFDCGLLSLRLASWRNVMSVYMADVQNIYDGSYERPSTFRIVG